MSRCKEQFGLGKWILQPYNPEIVKPTIFTLGHTRHVQFPIEYLPPDTPDYDPSHTGVRLNRVVGKWMMGAKLTPTVEGLYVRQDGQDKGVTIPPPALTAVAAYETEYFALIGLRKEDTTTAYFGHLWYKRVVQENPLGFDEPVNNK